MEYLENTLIDFFGSQDMSLGIVSKTGKDRLQIKNVTGDNQKVQVKQILTDYGKVGADVLSAFVQTQNKIQAQLDEIDLELLWDVLSEQGDVLPLSEIAENYFGNTSSESQSAMARFLIENHAYFKRSGREFSTRTKKEIEEIKHLQKIRAERQTLRKKQQEWLAKVLKHDLHEPALEVPEEMKDLVQRISDYLMSGFNSDAVNLLADLHHRLSVREVGLLILKNTDSLPPDADEFLLVNGIHAGFSQESLDAVDALKPITEDGLKNRENWADAELFSIDSESTREIDDALSIQKDADGSWIVGIHLADPGCYVHKDDVLDKVAADRPLSLYLPTTTVMMFPHKLGCDLASLQENELRPALSFKLKIKGDSGEVLEWNIAPSVVKIAHRLTYISADERIQSGQSELDKKMRVLYELSQKLQKVREEHGAINFNRPEMQIHVKDNQITVEPENPNTPSHNMVAEFMIQANHLAAKYALRNDIPIIYRAQEAPSEPVQSVNEYDPILFDQEVRKMKRTQLSTYPQSHFSLGLDLYTQVSSPLRRYADLVLHRQLAAHFSGGKLPYTQEELFVVLDHVDKTAMQNRMREREANKYWMLEYLKRNWLEKEIGATIVRVDGALVLAEIDRFCERGVVMTREKFKIGDRIIARIHEVNPQIKRLSMKVVSSEE